MPTIAESGTFVKIYPSYCCLFLLSLWKAHWAFAQGAAARPEREERDERERREGNEEATFENGEGRAEEDDKEGDTATEMTSDESPLPSAYVHSSNWDHENSLWHASIKPKGDKLREERFLLDRLSWVERHESNGLRDQKNLNWNLGLGGGTKAFAEGEGRWARGRRLGRHDLSFDIGLNGSFRQGSEYQSLDSQYSDAFRSGDAIEAEPDDERKVHENGQSLRLADRWSVQSDLILSADATQRNDSYRVGGSVDDRTRFSQLGFALTKNLDSRQRWEIGARLSELVFESGVTGFRQKQNLSEANTAFIVPFKGHHSWGFGYIVYDLRDVRTMRGPSLLLLREGDERLTWRAVLNYLNGPGNEHIFGEWIGSYRLTRTQTLRWSAVRDVDLFSSYSVLTSERLPFTAQQDSNLRTSLEWELRKAEESFLLRAVHNQQNFEEAKVREQSIAAAWVQPWNRVDTTTIRLERRRNQELGSVFEETERNYFVGSYGWKHEMESGSRLFGAKPYFRLEAGYESLADRLQDYRLERLFVLLGLGQEWL